MSSRRLLPFALAAALVAACSPDTTGVTALGADAQLARGSTPTEPAPATVTGTWTATLAGAGLVDSTQWSLSLTQRDTKLEGSLVRITYIGASSSVSVSAIKRGSISGQSVSLEFPRGEGAETPTTFGATVSDDGRSMTGYHSRIVEQITLVRR